MEQSVSEESISSKANAEFTATPSIAQLCIKFLVNQGEAGSIIGRKGTRIETLQKSCQVRAKLSTELNPKYPGTSFRIGKIIGD